MSPGDDAAFERLTRYVSARAGLALDDYKDKCLRRRVAVRMRACGAHTYDEFRGMLEGSAAELQRLTDVLTINVTKFYRNRETWATVTRLVAPELFQGEGPRRIWCAGCASGEEAHTLAMVLAEAAAGLGHPGWLERITIDATDIDRLSLEKAEAGIYTESALAETDPEIVARWMEPQPDGRFRVSDRLRRRIRVKRHDLLREQPLARAYDLITCRNVIIYFDRPGQERLMATFCDALRPGGFLLLGKVETILGPTRHRLDLIDARERLYRRAA
jgi:chemotaxis methyl-accepting protein methylase